MDEQLPPPGQLLLDILTLGGFVLLGLFIKVIVTDGWQRFDQWGWKRRLARQNEALRKDGYDV